MHLTGWYLLPGDEVSDGLDFCCNDFRSISRNDEVRGREEHPACEQGDGRHAAWSHCLVCNISVSVRLIVCQCPCTVCARGIWHFIFLNVEDWHGARLHGRRVPPEGPGQPGCMRAVTVAALVIPRKTLCLISARQLLSPQTRPGQVISISAVWKWLRGRMDSTRSEWRLGCREKSGESCSRCPIRSTSHQSHCEQCKSSM